MSVRLKAYIMVSALLRRAQINGHFAALIRKGDRDAGIVVIIERLQTLRLFRPERDMTGALIWHVRDYADQSELDTRLNKLVDFDPDLWIVEIEGRVDEDLLDAPIRSDVVQTPNQASEQDDVSAAIKAVFPDR